MHFVSTPQFCYIAPTSYLDDFPNWIPDFDAEPKAHLILAHLVDRDPVYAAKYAEFGKKDFIICDNSAYELKEPYKPEKLIELAGKSGATAIVLPDTPFADSQITIDAAREFAPQFHDAGFKTMFVPQSPVGELEQWISSYVWAAENPEIDIIGMSILGIPNALSHVDPAFARVVMTSILIDRGVFCFDKHHHYLGLNSGPGLEIPSLLRMNALSTIDSSGPIFAAIHGHGYTTDADSLQLVKKLKAPVDFTAHRTKDHATLVRIKHNIDMTEALFRQPNKQEVWYATE